MYKISVPVINNLTERMGREALLKQLNDLNAERVFLACGSYSTDKGVRQAQLDALRENLAFYRANGFEVGVWLWTFMIPESTPFTKMKSCDKGESENEYCPSDAEFRRFAVDYLAEIASTGVDMIMFDDDFRYGYFDCGLGCVCKNHIKYIETLLDESLTGRDIKALLLSGEKNKYRDAWIKANGHFFEVFAREVEKGVHAVAPQVRIGLCSCMTGWDFDGIDTPTLSKILAGNTKPFMRLIGAPYWAVNRNWGNRLQNIIEDERMERSWITDTETEVFSEGDAWPRPRYSCPAAFLEIFDTALRADGKLDGILKYGIDYFALPEYETGYIERHKRNTPIYNAISQAFDGKECVGVRVYERQRKFCDMRIPERMAGKSDIEDCFFSPASKLLADNTIPTVYSGAGSCGAAFAENVLGIPDEALIGGLIIDLRAAELLQLNGIDVGLNEIGEEKFATREYLTENILDIASEADKSTWLNTMVKSAGNSDGKYMFRVSGYVKRISVSENAKVISRFRITDNGEVTYTDIPASYLYENASGMKFLVFAFEGYFNGDELLRGYWRGRSIQLAARGFFGKPLPAYSCGNPDLYMLAKANGRSLSVGLWNIFADTAIAPEVVLGEGEKYSAIEFINCNGKLNGNTVTLSDIAPYGFASFTVRKEQ